jgi:paraquat-inducible protein B
MSSDGALGGSIPQASVIPPKRTGISAVWIIPIVAAIAGAWVAISRIESEGPKIAITFDSADGLEAGKTRINYRGVDVGTLTTIRLSEDHLKVVATAETAPRTENFLVDDTQFWVVRPRISGSTVSGLGTLISGAYIGMQIGNSHHEKREFIALTAPPVIASDVAGRTFFLRTTDLGSLDTGTPVFFRRLQVGQIVSYKLDSSGQFFSVRIFVRCPYDQFVTSGTLFWQASGVDMQLSASGLSVQTQSLLSMLIGGIAFETPPKAQVIPAAADATFNLYESRTAAFEPAPVHPQVYQLLFNSSVRGLSIGAPVEFRGIKVGQVVDIEAQIDTRSFKFSIPVTIELDAQKLGVKFVDLPSGVDLPTWRRRLISKLVSQGARAQLKTGNLLTGEAFVAIDLFANAAPASIDWSQSPPRLPTIPGQLETTEAGVESIVRKFDSLPMPEIGENLNKTLVDLDLTLNTAHSTLTNAGETLTDANGLVQPNSAELQQLNNTLTEVSRAARSVRVLADFLEEHPEALIRGRPGKIKDGGS